MNKEQLAEMGLDYEASYKDYNYDMTNEVPWE